MKRKRCNMNAREYHDRQEIEGFGNQVNIALAKLGIQEWDAMQRIARLMCEAYDTYPEANELAESLGLEPENIWCFLGDEISMDKYNRWWLDRDASYHE